MKDFCNTTSEITLSNEADLLLQQLDMLLDTQNGEVLGSPTYGANFEDYIWDLNINAHQIEQYAKAIISDNIDLLGFACSIKVDILKGTDSDIILLSVELQKENTVYSKTYSL